ncbi:MAG: hypothetical protein CVV53_00250 [Spirochaetae bacterium HGW-Spirochaetae-9]|nr:MAG: hypothetical protein CVV53_00250 [Spirochaetae bacterium HGW-Spirochaetae-9]
MANEALLCIDLDRCWGCGTCEVACALEKKTSPGMGFIKVEESRSKGGEALPGSPQGRSFVPVLCQQCNEPACAEACPSGAILRGVSGLVEIDADLCIACGACEPACPYGAISISSVSGRPGKCDLCTSRQEAGLLPACVQHCPGKAITLGGAASGAPNETTQVRGTSRGWSIGKVRYIAKS